MSTESPPPRPQQADVLILLSRTIRFASEHPYAATGIFGAVVGSVATYRVMTELQIRDKVAEVVTPKVYEFPVPQEDLRRMLADPTAEIRWELPEISVIVTAEKRAQPKELPIVDA